MPDGNSPALRYTFAAAFIAACLYDQEFGVRLAGVYLAGLSLYQGLCGKVPLIDITWRTTGHLTGAAAAALSAAVIVLSMFLIFEPSWVISVLAPLAAPQPKPGPISPFP
jgi:hypothetical protein